MEKSVSAEPMSREQKLEAALKAAMRLRKAIFEQEAAFINLYVPRGAVEEFDNRIKELKDGFVEARPKPVDVGTTGEPNGESRNQGQ